MGIFYEIINYDGQKSYLFGTAPLNDEDVVTLPLEVKEAFDRAETCMFEDSFINLNLERFTKPLEEFVAEVSHVLSGVPYQALLQPLARTLPSLVYIANRIQLADMLSANPAGILAARFPQQQAELPPIMVPLIAQLISIREELEPRIMPLLEQLMNKLKFSSPESFISKYMDESTLEIMEQAFARQMAQPAYPYSPADIEGIKKNLSILVQVLIKKVVEKTKEELATLIHLLPADIAALVTPLPSALFNESQLSQMAEQGVELLMLYLGLYIDKVPPFVLAMLFSPDMKWISSLNSVNRLDFQLLQQAQKKGKQVLYLEDARMTMDYALGTNLSAEDQLDFYRFHEEHRHTLSAAMSRDLKKAYMNQDMPELQRLLRGLATSANAPAAVISYYEQLTIRSTRMAEKMLYPLNAGNTFIAVDAVNLPAMIAKLSLQGFQVNPVELSTRLYPIAGTIEDGEKVAAFRKIYNALYASQSSCFKSKGLFPTADTVLSIDHILDYVSKNPKSRSATAWLLAEDHFRETSANNLVLVAAIHKYSYEHSSTFGFFKRTVNFAGGAQGVTVDTIQAAAANSRTGIIRDALDGPRPLPAQANANENFQESQFDEAEQRRASPMMS